MRIRIQTSFVLEVPDGADVTMNQDITDAFVVSARALFPKIEDSAFIEPDGRLAITRLRGNRREKRTR